MTVPFGRLCERRVDEAHVSVGEDRWVCKTASRITSNESLSLALPPVLRFFLVPLSAIIVYLLLTTKKGRRKMEFAGEKFSSPAGCTTYDQRFLVTTDTRSAKGVNKMFKGHATEPIDLGQYNPEWRTTKTLIGYIKCGNIF